MSYLADCCKELLSGGPMEFKTNGPLISELANKISETSGNQTATVGAMNKIIREALEVVAGMGVEPQASSKPRLMCICCDEQEVSNDGDECEFCRITYSVTRPKEK